MNLTPIFRSLAVAGTLTFVLAACSSGTNDGDVNVERGSNKVMVTASPDGTMGADSATAGLSRDTTGQPTGKELYKAAGDAKDRNHDGLAD